MHHYWKAFTQANTSADQKTPLSKVQPALTHGQFLSNLVLTLLLRLNNHSLPPWLFFDVTEAFQGGGGPSWETVYAFID